MMNKLHLGRSVTTVLILLLSLAISCGRKTETQPAGTGGTLRESIVNDLVTLDPSKLIEATVSQSVLYNIYDTLIEFDDQLHPVPALAESWNSPDGRNWTFKIRRGVYFHDSPAFPGGKGRELVAGDVVFSFLRVLDAKGGSAGSWILSDVVEDGDKYAAGSIQSLDAIRAVDDRTVQIRLKRPYPNFIYRLYAPFLCIVPREAVESFGSEYGSKPVGTGPFYLASVSPSVEVRLARNERYWKKDSKGNRLPYLKELVFRVIKDPAVAFLEFERGNLDVVDLPISLAKKVFDRNGQPVPAYSSYAFKSITALDTQFYAFNLDKAPFKGNRALRQALNLAVDKERIARFILNDQAVPGKGVLPPPLIGATQTGYPYDPNAAKAKLAEAGYANGRGLPEIALLIDADEVREAVAQAVQSQLAEIGVRMRIDKTQFATLLEQAGKGDRNFFRMWWEIPYPDPGAFFFQFLSNLWPPTGYNFGRYKNPEVDKLYEQAIRATDPGEQKQLWQKMDDMITADAPWIFLYHSKRTRMLQPRVADYPLTPIQIRKLDRTQLKGE
jgi:ABC-type transport system substrate-binding protein